MTIEAEVAIIGGGIVGFAVAHFIASHHSTLIIEAEATPGYQATGRSAAVLVEAYEGLAVRTLTGLARRYLDQCQEELAARPLLSRRGQLVIANETRVDALERRFAELGDIAGAVERIRCGAARELCPILKPAAVAAALWEPGAADLDVDSLLQAFVRSSRSAGTRVLTDAGVTAIERSGAKWRLTLADGRSVSARILVNAAGAWAGAVGAMASAAPVPLKPLLRTALLVDPPEGCAIAAWPFVITLDEDVYFKPDAGKLMVSLADERPVEPCDAWPEDEDVALAVERLEAIATIAVKRVPHRWAGLRTFAPDRAPVIGWDPRVPDFCWAAGVGGFGVQTSPATGAIVANLIRSGTTAGFDLPLEVRRMIDPMRLV